MFVLCFVVLHCRARFKANSVRVCDIKSRVCLLPKTSVFRKFAQNQSKALRQLSIVISLLGRSAQPAATNEGGCRLSNQRMYD